METMEAERELPPIMQLAFRQNPKACAEWNRMFHRIAARIYSASFTIANQKRGQIAFRNAWKNCCSERKRLAPANEG